jgi:hypothetical protein
MYRVFRTDSGKVDAINRIEDGATVPFWDEADPLTIEFRTWVVEHPEFDISDHEPPPTPEPTPQPDWSQFRSRLSIHAAILRIVQADPRNLFLSQQLIAALWQLGGNPSVLTDVAQLWSMMIAIAPLSVEEVAQLSVIPVECHMPFQLDELGRIVPLSPVGDS